MKLLILLLLTYSINSRIKFTNNMQVLAVEDENEKQTGYFPKDYIQRLFSLETPTSRCIPENCEYCCLSLHMCGTKSQCEGSEFTTKIFHFMFLALTSVLISFLIYKIYMTDAQPEHTDDDKIDEKSLNMLISLFMHNRENRKKFKI
jgi:hypothetical protein